MKQNQQMLGSNFPLMFPSNKPEASASSLLPNLLESLRKKEKNY